MNMSLYSLPTFHGYSLWLCPSNGDDDKILSKVISDAATSLDTDPFPPHLSVIAAIHNIDQEQLLHLMDMFEKRLHHNFDNIFVPCLALKDIDCKPLFFQSVFCHPDVSPSIIAINKLACDVFDRTGNGCGYPGAYMPHLSVVYGDLTSAQKEATISTILSPSLIEKKFNFGSLQLWKTEGLHTEWSCVKKVPLPLPYFNNSLPRHTFQVRSRIKRSMSFDFRENHDMNFQSCTMTRSDIMQWAIARRALIAAHKAGMKQLRGERDYETSNGLDSHYSQLQKTQQQAHKFEKQLSRISEVSERSERAFWEKTRNIYEPHYLTNVIPLNYIRFAHSLPPDQLKLNLASLGAAHKVSRQGGAKAASDAHQVLGDQQCH